MTWQEMADVCRALREQIGKPSPSEAWPDLDGDALRDQILQDEETLRPAVDAKLRALFLLEGTPLFSAREGWLAYNRCTHALRLCEFYPRQTDLPREQAMLVLLKLLLPDDAMRAVWRRDFANRRARPDLN